MSTLRSCALVADDDAFFRIALGTLLKGQLGFERVLEAASLEEASWLLKADSDVGLALLDLDMPGMQSVASVAEVRAGAPDVTLVIVSGSTARDDILRALELGAHGYIPKVTGPVELCRALRMVLAGDLYVPPSLASALQKDSAIQAEAASAAGSAEVHLTQRQRDVLWFMGMGRSNKEIARELGLGAGTVKVHVAAVLRALRLPNRSAVAAYAARRR